MKPGIMWIIRHLDAWNAVAAIDRSVSVYWKGEFWQVCQLATKNGRL